VANGNPGSGPLEAVRVAIVTESFLPHVNGVTNSVLRVLEHLQATGHEALVVTPIAGGPPEYAGARVWTLASLPLPGYPQVEISLAGTRTLTQALEHFRPDVVHLASPFVVGPPTLRAAAKLGIPVVAVFQTDMAGFARQWGWPSIESWMWRRLERIHGAADRSLVPSRATLEQLDAHGIPRLALWPRGVDADAFNPRHRDESLRRHVGDGRQVLVGYVGRLAPEKEVEQLRALSALDDVRVVLIGDGPSRPELQRAMPDAAFLGFLSGDELSRAVASLDVMVHTGRHETFCQSIQEAMASGVPVVAPAAGGPLDLVDPSRTGWLYTPGDELALRDHVRDLAGDDAKRRAMGLAARAAVAHRSWPSVMRSLLHHYRAVIAERSTRFTGVG
jgi:phosphatidylinositol alpha 1,6-mannosyltransferase